MRYCRVCGKQFAGDEHFCSGCGIAADAQLKPEKTGIGRHFVLGLVIGLVVGILIGLLCFWLGGGFRDADEETQVSDSQEKDEEDEDDTNGGTVVVSGDTIEGPGFATAEDAIAAYLEAFRRGDVDAMAATFAVETYVEHYDVEAAVARYGAYFVSMNQLLRSDDAYTRSVNVARRYASITSEFNEAYFTLTGHEDLFHGTQVVESGGEEAFMDELMEEDWMAMLKDLEVNGIYLDDDLTQIDENLDPDDDQMSRALLGYTKMCGCEEYSVALVDLTIGGQDYLLSLDVACYDGAWYICQQSGMAGTLLGMSANSGGFALKD